MTRWRVPLLPTDRADRDPRPTIAGSRVRLAGKLRDGPAGEVVAVDGARRLVAFAGDREATWCELIELRRLP